MFMLKTLQITLTVLQDLWYENEWDNNPIKAKLAQSIKG